jgi:hypothetical protein
MVMVTPLLPAKIEWAGNPAPHADSIFSTRTQASIEYAGQNRGEAEAAGYVRRMRLESMNAAAAGHFSVMIIGLSRPA